MQRRWEEQLAGYVGSSFDVLSLGNWASQAVQFISKIVTALTLYFGAYLVIDGQLTVGELIAFNMLAGRVAQPVLAPGAAMAGFSSGAGLDRAARRHPQHHAGAGLQRRRAPRCRRSAATSPSSTSLSATGSMGRRCCTTFP